MRIFWFSVILAVLAVAHTIPAKKKQAFVDDSDRTLIRVTRSDLDEDEPKHNKHVKKLHHHKRSAVEVEHKRNRRAEVEDNFFQALLSRTADVKQEKKRSFDDSADSRGSIIRDDWKGDSRISDVDRQELETLFSAINTEEDAGEEKREETRSLKQGFDGKVDSFIEWLLSQPPNKFTKSLSHILDVQTKLTKMFYGDKSNVQQDQAQVPSQNSSCTTQCFNCESGRCQCNIVCDQPTAVQQPAAQNTQQLTYAQPSTYPVQPQLAYPYPAQPPSPVYYRQPAQLQPVQRWPVQRKCLGTLCAKSKAPKIKAPPANDAGAKVAPKPAPAPQAPPPVPPAGPPTFNVPGASIQMSPPTVTQGMPPMTPMDPYNPYQAQLPAPVVPPYQTGFQGAMKRKAVPQMPSDCENYSEKRCQVFMDWPTDKKNQIKASLRFKNNWSSDYKNEKSTKHNIFKAEVEKAMRKAYSNHKNFKDIEVTKLKDEDMKTLVEFTLKFKKKESGALRHLQSAISSDYLTSMPVYKDTLLRDGLPHRHRKIVASQQEIDDIPDSKPTEAEEDPEDTAELMSTRSSAYQGCFRDKKPGRDLAQRYSKYEMTPEWCIGRCKVANYKFAGLQYGYLCFCGNKFGTHGRAAEKECSSKCFGDKKRRCGAFWHNSVYSVDGDAHDPSEFEKMSDDDDDGTEDEKRTDVQSASGKGHAEVANHLMKAAEAALRAAKKLLPQGGKQKREPQDDLETEKVKAVAALGAAQNLMTSNALIGEEKDRKKRESELNTGKNLLVAYLSDVGGYDRQYRDVDDQDESGSGGKDVKFDYKRMVIDQSGDGEFVVKKKNDKIKVRRRQRRSLEPQYPSDEDAFDGPKKMASRAAREVDEPRRDVNTDSDIQISMPDDNSDAPGTEEEDATETEIVPEPETDYNPVRQSEIPKATEPAPSIPIAQVVETPQTIEPTKQDAEVVPDLDSVETTNSGESGSANDSEESTDQTGESGYGDSSGLSRDVRSADEDEKELSRRGRDVDEEDEDELPRKRGKNKKKRQTALNDEQEDTLKKHVKQGVSKLKDLVVELYRQQSTIKAFKDAVAQLRNDIVDQLKVPEDQREHVIKEIRSTMKSTAIEELKGMTGSIRNRLSEYAKDHPAVSIEAEEAGNSLKDIPLYAQESDEIKKKLKKRSVEIEQEIIKRSEGSDEIPDILKEHFKRNAPESEEDSRH